VCSDCKELIDKSSVWLVPSKEGCHMIKVEEFYVVRG